MEDTTAKVFLFACLTQCFQLPGVYCSTIALGEPPIAAIISAELPSLSPFFLSPFLSFVLQEIKLKNGHFAARRNKVLHFNIVKTLF